MAQAPALVPMQVEMEAQDFTEVHKGLGHQVMLAVSAMPVLVEVQVAMPVLLVYQVEEAVELVDQQALVGVEQLVEAEVAAVTLMEVVQAVTVSGDLQVGEFSITTAEVVLESSLMDQHLLTM